MSLAGIMIFALAAALAAVLLKQIKSEYSIFLVTGAAIYSVSGCFVPDWDCD